MWEWLTMSNNSKLYKRPEPEVGHKERNRACLSCGRPFMSEWFGNRICKHCKGTHRYALPVAASISRPGQDN